MGYVAKGSIVLNAVSDAYTVSLSKPSCVIHADFDGSNPQLGHAKATIEVLRGGKSMEFDCIVNSTGDAAKAKVVANGDFTQYELTITSVPNNVLEGVVSLYIATVDGHYSTTTQFGYSIVRESTMLDWIQDWEGGKTKVGGTYIMTPKLFIGRKSDFIDYAEGGSDEKSSIMSVPKLTGVYIGPDSDSTGIYGYKDSVEIFHLNSSGGAIGGWNIDSGGICSADGLLSVLSDGTIKAVNDAGSAVWEIRSDGYASFGNGAIKLYANGNAEYKGKVIASSGGIGGWSIGNGILWGNHIYLDSSASAIYILKEDPVWNSNVAEYSWDENLSKFGGVAMYYGSSEGWGIVGFSEGTDNDPGSLTFSLGSKNKIAGWSFDDCALWYENRNNTAGAYTTKGITIGSSGIRSCKWRLESDGSGALAGNNITWDASGNMKINATISANNITSGMIASAGIKSPTNLWCLNQDGSGTLAGNKIIWDAGGNMRINATLSANNISSGTISTASIKNASGTWCLNQDGSGLLAGGNIAWGADGDITIEGAVNNLVTAINLTAENISDTLSKGYLVQSSNMKSNVTSETGVNSYYLNPLKCGNVMRLVCPSSGVQSYPRIWLPTAYRNSSSEYRICPNYHSYESGESQWLPTLQQMRQMIGKKLYIYTEGVTATDPKAYPWAMSDMWAVSSGGTGIEWGGEMGSPTTQDTPTYGYTSVSGVEKYYPLLLRNARWVALECCVGVFSTYECIYWKVSECAPGLHLLDPEE